MALANLVFNGDADLSILGNPVTKDGCWSLRWQDMRVHVKPGTARFKMRNITVAALDNHNFGSYTVHFTHGYLNQIFVRVTGKNNHPHWIRGDQGMCWGNFSMARDHALERGDVETVAGLARAILQSFNPGDAFSGWWGGYGGDARGCITCGDTYLSYDCAICRSNLCDACVRRCRWKRDNFCEHCMRDRIGPERCVICTIYDCRFNPRYKPVYAQLEIRWHGDRKGPRNDDDLPF